MNALEAFGHDRLDARQPHALGRPVAGRALPIVGTGNDDQRLLALHVGFDGFPHPGHLALRLQARQRTLLHAAIGFAHHLVEQLGVGEGGTLGGQVVTAVGGVGVEVLLRQAHLGQVLASGAVEQDGVGRRQVVGGDVVRQHGQRTHALEAPLTGQRAFPVRRTADVGGHRTPVVQRALGFFHRTQIEHRDVDLLELLRLHRGGDDGVDFLVARPQILQGDRVAVLVGAQRVLLDVEAHGTGDGVGDHQRRRGQEGLLGVRVDTAVEVTVARQYGGGVQVAVDDFLLDHRVQRTGHAVAGGAGEGDDAKAELFQLLLQPGLFQVQLHGLGARRQRRLDPRFAGQAQLVGIARQQACGNHVARVAGVGATGDGGDDHGAIRQQAVGLLGAGLVQIHRYAAGGQVGNRQAAVRVGGARQGAHHAGQIEAQHALVLGARQAVGPEARLLGIGLHQLDLFTITAGEPQVVDGLLIDEEHGRGGAVFRRHVGDGGAIPQGQGARALTTKLQVGADHFFLAQELGQGEHHVGGGDASLRLATELDADDLRQAHPGGAPQHHVLGFQTAHAHRDHPEGVDVGGVAVGADTGVRVGDAPVVVNDRRHLLQVDLVHDAVARLDHIDVLERLLGPVDEMEAVFVATVFDGAVLVKGLRVEATALDGQRVIDDQLHRHDRVDCRRVATFLGDGVTQAGEVDQRGLAEDVVAHHASREPREVEVALAFDQLAERGVQGCRVAAAHQVFGEHARGIRQVVVGTGLDGLDRGTGIEIVQVSTWQGFAVCSVHKIIGSVTVRSWMNAQALQSLWEPAPTGSL
ncbi:hypothetical protein D3C78_745560 [compost metagenome]